MYGKFSHIVIQNEKTKYIRVPVVDTTDIPFDSEFHTPDISYDSDNTVVSISYLGDVEEESVNPTMIYQNTLGDRLPVKNIGLYCLTFEVNNKMTMKWENSDTSENKTFFFKIVDVVEDLEFPKIRILGTLDEYVYIDEFDFNSNYFEFNDSNHGFEFQYDVNKIRENEFSVSLAKNVNTYTIIFDIIDKQKYRWRKTGNSDSIYYDWKIIKAIPTLTLSDEYVTLVTRFFDKSAAITNTNTEGIIDTVEYSNTTKYKDSNNTDITAYDKFTTAASSINPLYAQKTFSKTVTVTTNSSGTLELIDDGDTDNNQTNLISHYDCHKKSFVYCNEDNDYNQTAALCKAKNRRILFIGNCSGTQTFNFRITESETYSEITFSIRVETRSPIKIVGTYAEINECAQMPGIENVWKPGDYIVLNFTSQLDINSYATLTGIIQAYILGINHNPSEEGMNRVHFCLGRGIAGKPYKFRINNGKLHWASNFYNNVFRNSNLSEYLNYEFYNSLPEDLKSIMVKKITYSKRSDSSISRFISIISMKEFVDTIPQNTFFYDTIPEKEMQYDYFHGITDDIPEDLDYVGDNSEVYDAWEDQSYKHIWSRDKENSSYYWFIYGRNFDGVHNSKNPGRLMSDLAHEQCYTQPIFVIGKQETVLSQQTSGYKINMSFTELNNAIKSGNAKDVMDVGCYIEVPLDGFDLDSTPENGFASNGMFSQFAPQTVKFYVAGIDHNYEHEGINRVHFMLLRNSTNDEICILGKKMYNDYVNEYSDNHSDPNFWRDSDLNNWLNTVFFNALPEELRNLIVPITKSTKGNESTSKIFIMSAKEIINKDDFTDTDDIESVNEEYYEIFKRGLTLHRDSQVPFRFVRGNVAGSRVTINAINPWWVRSTTFKCADYGNNFDGVPQNSYYSIIPKDSVYGVVPCFVLGESNLITSK
jgi:hypothetical protein